MLEYVRLPGTNPGQTAKLQTRVKNIKSKAVKRHQQDRTGSNLVRKSSRPRVVVDVNLVKEEGSCVVIYS